MKFFITFITALILFNSAQAQDCPSAHKVPDINCDGRVMVTVIGDSLVAGIGDTKNDNKGGYVLRASAKLKKIEFNSVGVPGLRTLELLKLLKQVFSAKSELAKSDIVILDIGRNDRWLFGEPLATYRNLKRASAQIKKAGKKSQGKPPLVVTAVLMLPNRGSQGPWVKELNSIILKNSTKKDPGDLRFDLVSKRLLNSDQVHPTSQGYEQLSKTLVHYLSKTLPKKISKKKNKKQS